METHDSYWSQVLEVGELAQGAHLDAHPLARLRYLGCFDEQGAAAEDPHLRRYRLVLERQA